MFIRPVFDDIRYRNNKIHLFRSGLKDLYKKKKQLLAYYHKNRKELLQKENRPYHKDVVRRINIINLSISANKDTIEYYKDRTNWMPLG